MQPVAKCFHILQITVLLSVAACQTTDDAPSINTWNSAPAVKMLDNRNRPDRLGGAQLLANDRGGKTTIIEGTGRFVGDPGIEVIKTSPDVGDGGVTLNLLNVPTAQAAKTILGDILSVKYAVDPKVEGKITIQTPKPVARAAVVDLFQSALRLNNAVITNKDGVRRLGTVAKAAGLCEGVHQMAQCAPLIAPYGLASNAAWDDLFG